MKHQKRYLLPVFTLLLVAAGAAMPFAAAYMQDARQSDPEVRSFDSFRLTLKEEADLGRTLKLIAGWDYYVEDAQQAADARMSQVEVLTAAEELMKGLIQFGLMDQRATSLPSIWPQTLCANDGSVSIPTWTLQWDLSDERSDFYVWMDDTTGKAFMISVPSLIYTSDYVYNASSEPLYASAENWRAFLADYYGTEVTIADEEWFDTSARFALAFSLGTAEDGEQASFHLDLYIYFVDGFTSLSPYVTPLNVSENEAVLPYDS